MKQNSELFNRATDLMNLYGLYSSGFLDTKNVEDFVFWRGKNGRKAGQDRGRVVYSGDRSQSAGSMSQRNGMIQVMQRN